MQTAASDPFFHRRRVKPNGQTEEITLGAPFARVLIAVCTLVTFIILAWTGVDVGVLLSSLTKLIGP